MIESIGAGVFSIIGNKERMLQDPAVVSMQFLIQVISTLLHCIQVNVPAGHFLDNTHQNLYAFSNYYSFYNKDYLLKLVESAHVFKKSSK